MVENDIGMNDVSVAICTKNSAQSLNRCLQSISKFPIKEIIIIDGCSKDNTIEIAKKYTNKIFSDSGKGLGCARQLGAEKACGKLVAYIDSDTQIPNKEVFVNMIDEIKKNKWVAVHALIIDPRDDKNYWEYAEDFHWRKNFVPGEREFLNTLVCIIRRDIILEYRFDPFFKGAAEDYDFFHRIRKNGHRIGVCNVAAYHYHRNSFKDFAKQRIWYGKGNARLAWRHRDLLILYLFSPFIIISWGMLFAIRTKINLMPFYFIWGGFLLIGVIKGLFEIIKDTIFEPSAEQSGRCEKSDDSE